MAENAEATVPEFTTNKIQPIIVNRIVLVIGTTGTGKSTIINMLYNDDTTPDACQMPCKVKETAMSVTQKPQWILDRKNGKIICDTVGFGDNSQSNNDIIAELKSFLGVVSEGIHSIIVVAKYGRLTREEHLNLLVVSKLFGDNWKTHTVLVLTHCDVDIEEQSEIEKAIDTWIEGDDQVKEFVNLIDRKNVLLANNATSARVLETGYRPARIRLLKDLNCFINKCNELVAPSPNFLIYVKACLSILFHAALSIRKWPLVVSITVATVMAYKGTSELALNYANIKRAEAIAKELSKCTLTVDECSICLDQITFENMVLTNCHHEFHAKCINPIVEDQNPKCPNCRENISDLYKPILKIETISMEMAKVYEDYASLASKLKKTNDKN